MEESKRNKYKVKNFTLARYGFIAFLAVLFVAPQAFSAKTSELKTLYEEKQYFDLRDRLHKFRRDRSGEVIFYRGAVANKFNDPRESIRLLNLYLKDSRTTRENLRECYSLLADNYTKTFQHARAAETYQTLLQKFAAENNEKEKAGYLNVFELWNALSNVPPQKVLFQGDSTILGVKEEVGLTVPLEINGNPKEYLIFDTGANISTITESLAKKVNLQIIEAQIDVGSITGEKVKAKLGVAKRLKLGNVVAENVVFLIFPDKALYIEPIDFQIKGLVGFPVIAALQEITWNRDEKILIPAKPANRGEQNLALNNLTPLIAGHYQGKRLIFGFDTGASNTSFYQPFFKAFESEVIKAGTPKSERISGIGGSKEVKGYILDNLKMSFAGKPVVLRKLEVFSEKTTDLSQYLYGNIGRDVIDQFEKMTMNFRRMAIVFD